MATTCKLIAKTSLGSSAANIEFTSIPSTYTDLLLVICVRSTWTSGYLDTIRLQFNSATTGYPYRSVYATGTTVSSVEQTSSGSAIQIGDATTGLTAANTFSSAEIYVPNYSGSTYKTVSATCVSENNSNTDSRWSIQGTAGLWESTTAISSVKLGLNWENFAASSSAYLYGITKA